MGPTKSLTFSRVFPKGCHVFLCLLTREMHVFLASGARGVTPVLPPQGEWTYE